MDPSLFLRGLVLGFTIAAAVGPISLLVIRRTLAYGRIYGLASGIGVALADATYGGVAAFGLTAITSVLVDARAALAVVGGAFLVYLAWRTMTSRPKEVAPATDRPGLVGALLSTFGLTMTNPIRAAVSAHRAAAEAPRRLPDRAGRRSPGGSRRRRAPAAAASAQGSGPPHPALESGVTTRSRRSARRFRPQALNWPTNNSSGLEGGALLVVPLAEPLA